MTDREAILSALQRVQSGEISPEEATEQLLVADHVESLESIIGRLGRPPEDVIVQWCDQLRSIACLHESESEQPLPEIELDQWTIDSDGKLLWRGRRYQVSGEDAQASQTSLDRIQSFQSRWVADQTVDPDQPTVDPNVVSQANSDVPNISAADSDEQTAVARAKPIPVRSRRNTIGALASVTLFLIASAFVLFQASRSEPTSLVQQQETTTESRNRVTESPANSDPNRPSTEQVGTDPDDLIETDPSIALETFELTPGLEADSLASELSVTLDGLLPPIDGLDSPEPTEPPTDTDSASPAQSADSDPAATDDSTSTGKMPGLADAQLDDDQPAPEESPQETQESTVMAVRLAEVGDVDKVISLADRPLNGLKIDFPIDLPLEIKGEKPSWTIEDTRSNVSLAAIHSSPDGTELSWSERAKQSPNVSALAHGRITDNSGSTIFLRPTIESDRWQFRFDRPDVMPTWNLGDPIPPQVARLAIDFDLPDDIEFGWVEPVEPSELRRTRALAVITPEGNEDISLGVRFDIRCNRKLSCRIRFAARLDPSMNWQRVSTPSLERFSDQLTNHENAVSNESTRLANVYSMLNRKSSRRLIRAKQKHNKQLAEQVATAAQRVAQLQTLIAALETEGTIGFRVWVEWPDTEQEILSVSRTDNSVSE